MASKDNTTASDAVEDGIKREALRQAGLDFFERVLAEASTGKDPFASETAKPEKRREERRTGSTQRSRLQREDPDLEAVGAMISGARLYILTAAFVVCSAAGFVLFKACLNPLETPGILAFLHLLPLACVMMACSGVLGLEPVTLEGAKASLMTCIPSMLQLVMLFSVLIEGSVLFMLSYCLVSNHIFQIAAEHVLIQTLPSIRSLWFCVAGIAALGIEIVGEILFLPQPAPSFSMVLALLAYSLAKFAEVSWEILKKNPHHMERLLERLPLDTASKFTGYAEAQAGMTHGNILLYNAMLGSFIALCLGFIGMEGNELIEHELSVPAVTAIMLSLICYIGACVSDVLLFPNVTPRLRTGLLGVAAIGTIFFDIVAPGSQNHLLTIASSLIAISTSAVGTFLHSV